LNTGVVPTISTPVTNSIAIGNNAGVDDNNQVIIGNAFTTKIGGAVGWTTFSDGRFKKNIQEDVKGLDFILKLRPVTYDLDLASLNENSVNTDRDETGIYTAQENIRYTGFIAQEVEKTAKEIGFDFNGVDKPKNEQGHYGLRYAEFVAPLVKAMQEQQLMIQKLENRIGDQTKLIEQLTRRLDKLEVKN